jgi:hypothetical protein
MNYVRTGNPVRGAVRSVNESPMGIVGSMVIDEARLDRSKKGRIDTGNI